MRRVVIFLLVAIGTFIVDQGIKDIFVAGYDWQSKCISLELHYNNGVAFSMFSALGANLKWIQAVIIAILALYVFITGVIKEYPFALGLIIGGAIGNLYDRFIHPQGVVDYVYWHCGFDFAVFNYADVMIDIGLGWILIVSYLASKKEQN